MRKLLIIFTFSIFFTNSSNALIEIDITRGNLDPLPIAVSPLHVDIKSEEYEGLKIKKLGEDISKIIEKNEGEVVKTENWGLLNLSYLIKKNRKGSYIHFKIKGRGNVIDELEKNEAIDKKLLRYLTVKVKKFDLNTSYFGKTDENEKKESLKNNA